MEHNGMKRREFFKAASVAAGAFALHGSAPASAAAPRPATGLTPPNTRLVGVRQDISTWTPTQLTALNAAVGVMMARDPSNPTSWCFQANIHGSESGSNPAWNQCQHGSWWFLPWHRAYLYYFERILSAAAQEAGYPALWLPYWNYSPAANQSIPTPYRMPATYANLYQEDRNAGINEGAPLTCDTVDWTAACNYTNFLPEAGNAPDESFGGGSIPAPSQFAGEYGQLEIQPHNVVHDAIGGLMGDILTAAQDPVFWAHHANIDRMWSGWLAEGGGRLDPLLNEAWMTQTFNFYNEQGQQVTVAPYQVVNTTALGYSYDSLPSCPGTSPCTQNRRFLTVVSTRAPAVAGPRAETRQELVLGREAVNVQLRLPAATRETLLSASTDTTSDVVLRLDGVRADRNPGIVYDVYLNLPEADARAAERLTPSHPHYLATLEFFQVVTHTRHGPANGVSLSARVDQVVTELRRRGALDSDTANITIVPSALVRTEARPQPRAQARVANVLLHTAPRMARP
jgi:hypothetical protein